MANTKSFAPAVGGAKVVEYSKDELKSYYGMITEKNSESKITPSKELTTRTNERTIVYKTIVYKTYNIEKKKLQQYELNFDRKMSGSVSKSN